MDALRYELRALADQNPNPWQRFFRKKRLQVVVGEIGRLHVKKGARILDLGCGAGFNSFELARRGHRVTGVDIHKDFVTYANAYARKHQLPARFLCNDITKPLRAGHFDVVLISEVIEHMKNPLPVFQNIARSLKRGGYLVLTVPNHSLVGEFTEFLWSLFAKYNWVEEHNFYYCNSRRLRAVLARYGLHQFKAYTIFYLSHFLPFHAAAEAAFRKEIKHFSEKLMLGVVLVSVFKMR